MICSGFITMKLKSSGGGSFSKVPYSEVLYREDKKIEVKKIEPVDELMKRIKREDDELLIFIKSFLKCSQ